MKNSSDINKLELGSKKVSNKNKIRNNLKNVNFEELRSEVLKMTYEESLNALDKIINDFQTDSILLDDLQKFYIKANLYLEHCESLLENLEQEIIHIEPEFSKEI